ncbi:MAG TPA: succinate dehydrogenase [Planctomycetaceae bacterium]|nr:succinate dehydrogenase [Planctomycetaceae bacterium]
MSKSDSKPSIDSWQHTPVPVGSALDLKLAVSESYSGMDVQIPIHIRRGQEPGPTVFITAALHGDEINGTGTIRQLLQDESLVVRRGALLLAPVLNLLGFDRHSRYLPDRRDLNRSFPGSSQGSLASRMARTIFDEIVSRCDYGIDLHTASVRRTNYPNVRADLDSPKVLQIAEAFGCELLLDGKGPRGSLRREATRAGCPTIVFEGGEVSKVEPRIVESAIRGVKNTLSYLGMTDDKTSSPDYQLKILTTKWVRADRGGFLQFHVKPGEIIEEGQPIATNTTLLGREQRVLHSPFAGVVIGMTTLPATSPGEPICHIGQLPSDLTTAEFARLRKEENGLEQRVVRALASNVMVTDRE